MKEIEEINFISSSFCADLIDYFKLGILLYTFFSPSFFMLKYL
jgi:hypothetical protein